jgi:hypothetical protein
VGTEKRVVVLRKEGGRNGERWGKERGENEGGAWGKKGSK